MAQTTQNPPPTGLFPAFSAEVCKEWGWVAFRGVLAILFGILALIWPLATIWTLTLFWGAFALADGIAALVASWRLHQRGVRWWPYVIYGLIGVGAGVAAFIWPGLTALALVYIIAFWAIFGGVSQIIAAIRLRKEIEGEGLLIIAGLISIAFGILVAFRPFPEGIVAISILVGSYAMFAGFLYIALALKLRQKAKP